MNAPVYGALARAPVVSNCVAALQKATGLTLALLPANARATSVKFAQPKNLLCLAVAKTTGGRHACWKTHRQILQRVGKTLTPQCTHCFAGLSHVAVPVVVGGQHVATLFGGQVLCGKATRRSFARVAKLLLRSKLGTDLSRLKKAYFRTRVIPENEFGALLHLLHVFAQLLAELAPHWMIAIRRDEPPWLAQAKGYLNSHAAERLKMGRVASLTGLSRYHFCRLFHKTTGMTYTEYLAGVRVEKAKHLLFDPSLRVTDVAFDSGFQSLPHFERTFKRYTGLTPNAYRSAQRWQRP